MFRTRVTVYDSSDYRSRKQERMQLAFGDIGSDERFRWEEEGLKVTRVMIYDAEITEHAMWSKTKQRFLFVFFINDLFVKWNSGLAALKMFFELFVSWKRVWNPKTDSRKYKTTLEEFCPLHIHTPILARPLDIPPIVKCNTLVQTIVILVREPSIPQPLFPLSTGCPSPLPHHPFSPPDHSRDKPQNLSESRVIDRVRGRCLSLFLPSHS